MALSRTLTSLVPQRHKAQVVKNCLLGWISLEGEKITRCSRESGSRSLLSLQRNTQARHLRGPACPGPLGAEPCSQQEGGYYGGRELPGRGRELRGFAAIKGQRQQRALAQLCAKG